ncbi:MAG: hypothetical protein COU40_03935 [Candidatus Moranbacteria bacterium CG10_big_fil_rev_8_21_14_0_10_35_21]|nr:MAG: hypothetical protein COU40_03935 [Candidatus Moranbacteria bacterium CG10_big_fil_rev_8_21_14_0_10_35_21]PJA88418.1 MAG: hypothetical protein CO139_03300 [Candidatus Moranbacteria bacterium CG_4_9_14_3_um_filter_36_9]
MEQEKINLEEKKPEKKDGSNINNHIWQGIALIAIALLALNNWENWKEKNPSTQKEKTSEVSQTEDKDLALLESKVIPADGVEIPVVWGDFGKQMVEKGVIDRDKFEAIYEKRGGLSEEGKRLLDGENNGKLKITAENSGVILNLLWAFGLGNKNEILEKGPMVDKKYGGAGGFASTGGWSASKGKAMDHYSKYKFVTLTPEQQEIVSSVSQGIYRPCCGNSTYFPDCNHGMAMLGLLEIMASQGVSEKDMYQSALAINAYWFPDTYMTLAKYFVKKNIDWNKVDAKEVLGFDYSSSAGYQKILQEVEPIQKQSGGSCGV